MRARDTSARAAEIQERLHDALGVEGRFRLAMEMSDLAREFAMAGLRGRFPELSESDLAKRLAAEFYGIRSNGQ